MSGEHCNTCVLTSHLSTMSEGQREALNATASVMTNDFAPGIDMAAQSLCPEVAVGIAKINGLDEQYAQLIWSCIRRQLLGGCDALNTIQPREEYL